MSEGQIVAGQTSVVVHPLVLLSVVDHYNRACKVGVMRVLILSMLMLLFSFIFVPY
jgi:hypothetical protein